MKAIIIIGCFTLAFIFMLVFGNKLSKADEENDFIFSKSDFEHNNPGKTIDKNYKVVDKNEKEI